MESKVQYDRTLETTRFQELDEARSRYQDVQDRAYELQESLNAALAQFFTAGEISNSFDGINVAVPSQGDTLDDESVTGKGVEQFAFAVKRYRQLIDDLKRELIEAADEAQGELNELQLLAGSKGHEISALQALYEQKLSEPEFTPLRPDRHTIASLNIA